MNKQANALATALGIVVGLASVNTAAQAGDADVRFSTGVEYTSGDFGGTQDIEDLYVPVTASVDSGRLRFRLTAPFLSVNVPSGTTESGLGDVIGSVTLYDVVNSPDLGLVLDVTGTIKFGTADEDKGLGTGENDYSIQLEAYRFYDQFTVLGAAGYKLRGDPTGVDLENVFFGSVGGAFEITTDTQLGLYLDYRQSALSDSDDIQELTVFASSRLNDSWQFQIYAFTGFSDASPDWGGGVLLSTDFRGYRIRD